MSVAIMDDIAILLRGRPPKALARLARVHPRTAARWQSGESQPGAAELVQMMAADAGIFREVARLAGRASEGERAAAAQHLRAALAALEGRA